MIKNLVIVESPAKAKTIEKFLGKDYKVMSSYGHIRDLKKKDFGIDLDNSFTPDYEIPADKEPLVEQLRAASREARMVWLASDEDREGEAIAWHLYEVLGLDADRTRRIVFHEITPEAIHYAIEHPRAIDTNLVDAQQARRVLDRIVGFELSPVLWRKIKPALSAGRVQSVAVRLIVDREKEIKQFVSEPYFRVTAQLATAGGAQFRAELTKRLGTLAQARDFLDDCGRSRMTVSNVAVRPLKKSPAPPFTTSTLQQEAARKLGFTVAQTMMVAQRLYESGHITYMRTDSLNLSNQAMTAIANEITSTMGDKYLCSRHYRTSSKGAQEAHEAIRPTYITAHTVDGTAQEKRLYNLIWKRAVASQMADADIEKTTVEISLSDRPDHLTASGEVIRFDGYLRVYDDTPAAEEPLPHTSSPLREGELPAMREGDTLEAITVTATERFTQHPPRYTEASLVKKMEELGIGRPSTYAPTISTIQHREYIDKREIEGTSLPATTLTLAHGTITSHTQQVNVGADKGKLVPTDIGVVVNEFLTDQFPNILDFNFTADMEKNLDLVAEGKSGWKKEIKGFYEVFHPEVERASEMRLERKMGERSLGVDPASGQPVSVKIGRFGPVVQIGDSGADEKPQFASLQAGQSVFDITLEEALKLFELPRTVGTYEDAEVVAAVGRFGPYLRHKGKFVSIPKTLSPTGISIDEAIELIEAKRKADADKIIRKFEEDADMMVLNGRYGPYIAYRKSNYKLPKTASENAAALTYADCMAIVKEQDAKGAKTTRSGRTAKSKKK